jgi:hypothetical protein
MLRHIFQGPGSILGRHRHHPFITILPLRHSDVTAEVSAFTYRYHILRRLVVGRIYMTNGSQSCSLSPVSFVVLIRGDIGLVVTMALYDLERIEKEDWKTRGVGLSDAGMLDAWLDRTAVEN